MGVRKINHTACKSWIWASNKLLLPPESTLLVILLYSHHTEGSQMERFAAAVKKKHIWMVLGYERFGNVDYFITE